MAKVTKASFTLTGGKQGRDLKLRLANVVLDQAKPAIRGAQKAVETLTKKAQDAAQQSVGAALVGGFPGVTSGGPQTLRYSAGSGAIGHMRTRSWAPLSHSYRIENPVSGVFWRKHPVGMRDYGTDQRRRRTLLSMYMEATIDTPQPKTEGYREKDVRVKGRRSKALSWTVKFATPKNSLRHVISDPMAQGVGSPFKQHPGDPSEKFAKPGPKRNTIGQLLWTEARRPFVRDVSYAIGRRLGISIQDKFEKVVKRFKPKGK